MPAGRMGAQCAHVAAKLAKKFPNVGHMTTLVLQVRDSKYLERTVKYWLKFWNINFIEQYDNLPNNPKMRLQAIATVPITKTQAQRLWFFDLWQDT